MRIARRPDDRPHARLRQVQRQQRVGHAGGIGQHLARRGLGRQVEAVALDVGVGGVEHRVMAAVAGGDVLREIGREAQRAVLVGRRHAEQRDALACEAAEVDGASAMGAADRDGDVLDAGVGPWLVPIPSAPSHQQKSLAAIARAAGGRAGRRER